jgi:hypothetical protein
LVFANLVYAAPLMARKSTCDYHLFIRPESTRCTDIFAMQSTDVLDLSYAALSGLSLSSIDAA